MRYALELVEEEELAVLDAGAAAEAESMGGGGRGGEERRKQRTTGTQRGVPRPQVGRGGPLFRALGPGLRVAYLYLRSDAPPSADGRLPWRGPCRRLQDPPQEEKTAGGRIRQLLRPATTSVKTGFDLEGYA